MAFLSDIYLPAAHATRDGGRSTTRRRVNWRLLLALGLNLAVWTVIIQFVRSLF